MPIKLKPLELTDRDFIAGITSQFLPYSDFSFLSLWSWDVRNELRIGELNGNLVVKFNDYLTGEPFYSFLGDKNLNETAQQLFEISKQEGLKTELRLVPEECASALDPARFVIEESRANFDYIYPIPEIMTYSGNAKYRQAASSFIRKHNPEIREMYLYDPETQKQIFNLIDLWVENKVRKAEKNNVTIGEDEFANEYEAIRRLFRSSLDHFNDVKCFGAYVDGSIAGFLIDEKISKDYCVSHFGKVNVAFTGAMQVLMQHSAVAFNAEGVEFYNDEQDLGLEHLKSSKSAYGPVKFLKKYVITTRQ